jgi:hypothetical protein
MARQPTSVKKYVVRLNGEERAQLEGLIGKGKGPAKPALRYRKPYSALQAAGLFAAGAACYMAAVRRQLP